VLAAVLALAGGVLAPPAGTPRETIAPKVAVERAGPAWRVSGSHTTVTLQPDLALAVAARGTPWAMAPSSPGDLRVRAGGRDQTLRLADARDIRVEPYRTGFRTGVKARLAGWPAAPQLAVVLTLGLEGGEEDLAVGVVAEEQGAEVRQLDWPGAMDASEVEYTVMPHVRGNLIPRHWPTEFHPIRPPRPPERTHEDTSEIQSHVIESWSMSWWGFRKGRAAAMAIVETPDDAAYQFAHPAGGPTVVGPRWRARLGRLAYPRAARFAFFADGDYVTMAKRYRRHAVDSGLFVPLAHKIATRPQVKALVGTPLSRVSILRNLKEDSQRYDARDPSKNYALVTFDQRAEELRALKAKGLERFHVCLTGWPWLGYDRQHPDELPPAPAAGGVDGLRRLADTARALGYVLTLHDQYRDYYVDAPSFDTQFAIHEEDEASPPKAFPGTRFGTWKEGRIPYMRYWDGGKQAFLNSRFMFGHLRQNYEWLLERGVKPDGVYLDVFGYVPPDEDWNPQHPTTRSDNLRDRAASYVWVRERLGIVGTEAACDWTVPYADISSPLRPARVVPVPLFELVYHDAILTTYAPTDLRGFLHAGVPQAAVPDLEKNLEAVRRMAALNERLATVEMTRHEFLDAERKRERTTFADGTTVTLDWTTQTVEVKP
jgi:hypothetical protein